MLLLLLLSSYKGEVFLCATAATTTKWHEKCMVYLLDLCYCVTTSTVTRQFTYHVVQLLIMLPTKNGATNTDDSTIGGPTLVDKTTTYLNRRDACIENSSEKFILHIMFSVEYYLTNYIHVKPPKTY